jgi:hypothetical protein
VHVLSVVARPIWVDRDAGWVVRDVLTSLRDPEMAARIGTALDDSWRRTASVVGPYLPLV